jgi:translation initiation factor IF-3
VRVIADDNTQLGVLPTHEALRMAEEKGLDLVEVSPKAVPPVCRIMDYGKFKYEQSKKTKQARKHSSTIEVKEIKFRPKTDDHDFDFKLRHIRRFLEEGDKVRLVIAFRGREIVHPETGRNVLERVLKACTDIAHVEQIPLMDGRRMVMVVSPKAGLIARPPVAGAVVRPVTVTAPGAVSVAAPGGAVVGAAPAAIGARPVTLPVAPKPEPSGAKPAAPASPEPQKG